MHNQITSRATISEGLVPSGLRCPKCDSSDIRRSLGEGVVARALTVFGRWPFRCRSCQKRFFRPASPPPEWV